MHGTYFLPFGGHVTGKVNGNMTIRPFGEFVNTQFFVRVGAGGPQAISAAGDGTQDLEGFDARCNGFGQRGIRRFMGEVFSGGVEAH